MTVEENARAHAQREEPVHLLPNLLFSSLPTGEPSAWDAPRRSRGWSRTITPGCPPLGSEQLQTNDTAE